MSDLLIYLAIEIFWGIVAFALLIGFFNLKQETQIGVVLFVVGYFLAGHVSFH